MHDSSERILTSHGPRVGHPSIAWVKLEALVEGARLATRRVW